MILNDEMILMINGFLLFLLIIVFKQEKELKKLKEVLRKKQ